MRLEKLVELVGEIISSVIENFHPTHFLSAPINISLSECPAPCSKVLV